MPVTRKALLLLILVLTCSMFLAKISSLINVDIDELQDAETTVVVDSNSSEVTAVHYEAGVIGKSKDNLVWFVQISDTHISKFHDPGRISDMIDFCQHTIPAIKPPVVLASGDLTDAKAPDNMGSQQYEEEWVQYSHVLDSCGNQTVWLDMRGNHDNFNIPDGNSSKNYYRRYSRQGRVYPHSYLYQLHKGRQVYSFLAVDACLEPGPRRPFNFVGLLNAKEMDHIKDLTKEISKSRSQHTIWFGHYPTSCILSSLGDGIREVIASVPSSLAYLCGHFHTLGGAVPNMYTLQKAGFLELELGDWKDNRLFRVMAIDHGLLSFIDVHHRDWPIVLVTNPKHALFHIPGREPSHLQTTSTHIRVLVFSPDAITGVQVRLDDEVWRSTEHVEGPLYVLEWKPKFYNVGLHYVHVYVSDSVGRTRTVSQPFSLDGTRLSFNLLPRLALMCNMSTVIFFGVLLVICVVPLCFIKYLHQKVKAGLMEKPRVRVRCLQLWLRKLWILTTVDRLFYPLTLYAIYLTFGPWSVGAVIEDYVGAIFAWGIIVNGAYLPGSFTYAYGFLQLLFFQLPLTLLLAHNVDQVFQWRECGAMKHRGKARVFARHFPMGLLVSLQAVSAYYFWLAYGTMAFLLGPLRTWAVFLSLTLWYAVLHLPSHCLEEASLVWRPRSSEPLPGTRANAGDRVVQSVT